MCPIETPEGPNIGLIGSLATYATVNEFGFIETPYRKVKKGKVTDEIHSLTAGEEDKYIIAQANAKLDSRGRFIDAAVLCRTREGKVKTVSPEEIDYMDVSPIQLVSVATGAHPLPGA